ncbi:MAG: hypothetical protein RJA22_1871 [Verrucomicrobiota bacterium]
MMAPLIYLSGMQAWNRLRVRARRLRQPKYLAGALVGALYFYFYFFRFLLHPPGGPGLGSAPPDGAAAAAAQAQRAALADLAPLAEPLAALAVAVCVLAAWVFPQRRAALAFTEAEAVTLFAAPVSRRTLIHFKLLRSQFGILLTTLLFALVGSRMGSRGLGWIPIAGWWLILSVLNLHFLGASFARTRLLDWGVTPGRRRAAVLAGVVLVMGAAWWLGRDALRLPTAAELGSLRELAAYLGALLEQGPMAWVLAPCRFLVRPWLAGDAGAFALAAGPALLMLGLHYVWVVRSDVAFEEASLALAQERARMVSAARRGQFPAAQPRQRRDPFPLAPTGPSFVALFWKNLLAAGGVLHARTWIILGLLLAVAVLGVGLNPGLRHLGTAVAGVLAMLLVWSILIGPQLLRQDLRGDLRCIDLLKQYPMAGWRVVLGELLAPVFLLTVVQWGLLLLAGLALAAWPGGAPFPAAHRLSVGLAAALLLPALNTLSLLIPNGAVLLFPAWFQSGQDATQGFEAAGQRLILAFGQLLVFSAALVPAGLAFGLVQGVVQVLLQWHWAVGLPFAALAAAAVVAGEAAAGVALLGKVFERFDLSAEPPG